MYCTNCNAKIDAYIEICRVCGIRLDIEVLKDQRDTENLVARLKNGDSEAFAELYNKNYAKVLFAIRSFIKDEDAAMDLLQDTFIKAYQNIGQLKDDDHFSPWVRQIAANTAKNWLVKKKPDLFSYIENESEEFDDSFEDRLEDECVFDMPEEKLDRDETSRLIREILDDLPDNQRAVITLFFYQDMKVKDIAGFLSMPEGTVKSNLKYAREKIEKKVLKLEKEGTKLYGLVPLAFLLWLWKNMDAHANEITPDAQILSNVQEAVCVSGASGGASAGSGIASTGTSEGSAVAASGAAEGAATGTAAAAGTAAAGISATTVAIIATVVIGAGGGAVALSQLGGSSLSVEAQWQEQYDLGLQYYEDGQYEEAVGAFTEAITLIEEEPDAYVGRGDSYIELEEDKEALEDYLSAISYGADGSDIYVGAAEIYMDMEDYESVVSLLADAPESDETSELLTIAKNELIAARFLSLALEYEAAGELNAAIHTLWEGGLYWEDENEIYKEYQRIFVPISSIKIYDAGGAFTNESDYEYDENNRLILISHTPSSYDEPYKYESFEYDDEKDTVTKTTQYSEWYAEAANLSSETEEMVLENAKMKTVEYLYCGMFRIINIDPACAVSVLPYTQVLNEDRIWNSDYANTPDSETYEWAYADITYNDAGLVVRMDFYDEDGASTGWGIISYEGYESED